MNVHSANLDHVNVRVTSWFANHNSVIVLATTLVTNSFALHVVVLRRVYVNFWSHSINLKFSRR